MEHQDYLLTLAEVAAAFVGFSMLVGVIGRDSRAHDLRRSLLYDVAQIGFMVIGGALVPYALSSVPISPAATWRIASLMLLVTWIGLATLAYRRLYGVAGREGLKAVLGRGLWYVNHLSVLVGNALLLWNVVWPGPGSSARYLGALLMLLLIATYVFLRAGFAQRREEASDE